MKLHHLKIFLQLFICTCFICSCKAPVQKAEEPVSSVAPDLNAVKTNLPDSPGHSAFVMNCIVCHSARMVENQPDLPEKTWAATVAKMQKTFGAPVSDSAAQEIVKYLVAIKGTK